MSLDDLRRNRMMGHLLDALERGEDIGHYGRLVFAIVARHFVPPDDLVALLALDPGTTEADARALVHQVNAHDYSPPRRETILAWQRQQPFPICPDEIDPDAANVYRDLDFPGRVYEHIREYHVHKAEAEEHG